MLTQAELSRYSRQLVLPEIGVEGQERLRLAKVLVVGAGGLGAPVCMYLAAAGVGTIGIVDNDTVDLSNLHRQILHATTDVGREKTASAAEALLALNPHTTVLSHSQRLTSRSAQTLFRDYDLIVDGSDNYPTRYAINDACSTLGKTWVYGSVERFSGQVSVFGAPGGPCYRCIFPEPPAPGSTSSCEEIGVLGAVPGVVGSLQAVEALKCILGIGQPLIGRLLQLDLQNVDMRVVRFEARDDCACGAGRRDPNAADDGLSEDIEEPFDILPAELVGRLAGQKTPQLLDIREPWEWSIARIGDPQLLALGELERNVSRLDRTKELIVYCHHGSRSAAATEWLRSRGFRARNLAGGIDRWSREVDPSVSRY
jgi:sulfur-carrier protein adenylyltransferase/sulfurtransferase